MIQMQQYCVYILASRHHRHLSVGLACSIYVDISNRRRATNRRLGRTVCQKLVYLEVMLDMEYALEREAHLQRAPRRYLEHLVESVNPGWEPISLGRLVKAGLGGHPLGDGDWFPV